MQRDVPPHRLVGLRLDFRQGFRRNGTVKVDDGALQIHVEAHVVPTPAPVDNAGDDMLPAVLLHPQKPGGIVNGPFHRLPSPQGAVAKVDDILPPLLGIQHPDAAQCAGVRRLAAAQGIKGRGVQGHLPAGVGFLTGQDLRLKGPHMAVLII